MNELFHNCLSLLVIPNL